MLLDLHTDFSGGRSGGLVFPSLSEFSTVYCDPHIKGFGIVNKAEIDIFLELSCFFDDPVDVGNLISGSSASMTTQSHTLAWKIPCSEEPGRLRPRGHEESDAIEQLHFHFSLSHIGEGNGNQLQCSCLENPRDGGPWWAAVHGVAKSQTRLSDFTFTFHFHALEKEMATHSSVLAWRIPGTGEPGGLPSMGSHRVGHD